MENDDRSESTSESDHSESNSESDGSAAQESNENEIVMQALVYSDQSDLEGLQRDNLVSLVFGRPFLSVPTNAFFGCVRLKHLSFLEGLQQIGSRSFWGCSSLKTIAFPSSMLHIHFQAFALCGLESIQFNEGLHLIGNCAFQQCFHLKTVTISSSVKRIGNGAFQHCSKLRRVDFGKGIKEICESAFRGCSLTVIHLPPSLEGLHQFAFDLCRGLLSVELPLSGMRYISTRAFQDCHALTNVVLPPSPTQISETCFNSCGRLNEMFYPDLAHYPLNAFYHGIKKRYSQYPIHELCYKQSYMPTTTALENLNRMVTSQPEAISRADAAGMTPFHILSLSSRPEMSLFQTLQAYSPRWLMEAPDRWGFRPIQYMCSNSSIPKIERQRLVDYLANSTVIHRAHKLKLPKWRLAVLSQAREILSLGEATTLEESKDIVKIYKVLEQYELLEALCLLELRLWYCKLKSQEGSACESHDPSQTKRIKLDDHEFARVNCGADIVIGNVMPYLKGA